MKIIRLTTLLLIAYFLFPISIKVLSEYDMENILVGKAPKFSRLSNNLNSNSGKIYYGVFYKIISVRKKIEHSSKGNGSMIVGPMVTYHSLLNKLYFWTGNFFSEMQSLRVVRDNSDLPIII